MARVVSGISVDGLDKVNVNGFAAVATGLEFSVSIPFEEFGRSAAFNCTRSLHV